MSLDALAACDAELEALTIQLERARQKKAVLARERELREQQEQKKKEAQCCDNDLQRQIDELKRQLAAQELETAAVVVPNGIRSSSSGSSSSSTGGSAGDSSMTNNITQGYDSPCRRPERRTTIKIAPDDPHAKAPVCPQRRESKYEDDDLLEEGDFSDYDVDDDDDDVVENSEISHIETVTAPNYEPAHNNMVVSSSSSSSEQAKQKHAWEKPAWALPTEAIPDDSIQKDSIQNPLLKQAAMSSGYERKVHAAHLEFIAGKFVTHQEKQPDPRLVWIVVNIDGSKVGKIVMHLYGNFLPLTDIFLELKGLELKRGGNKEQFFVDDIDPAFYVHVGAVASFKGPTSSCYGVVLEGNDIVQKLRDAAPDAVFTIKQSHIYPVMKAK